MAGGGAAQAVAPGLASGGMDPLLLVVVTVLVVAVYLNWTANRLDRLHARVDAARASLDAALVRRAAVAGDLAASPAVRSADPGAAAALAEAATAARAVPSEGALPTEREAAENALGKSLRVLVGGSPEAVVASGLVADLDAAAATVALARRFYNSAVRDTRAMRRRRLVRALRLAGYAPSPTFFEIDDTLDELAALR